MFLEHSVYFDESQSSICDILLFLDFKCIKREPASINVVNQYVLEWEANAVVSTVPFKPNVFEQEYHRILSCRRFFIKFVHCRNSFVRVEGQLKVSLWWS